MLPLGPWFLFLDCFLALVFISILFKAHLGYLHADRACFDMDLFILQVLF